MKCHILNDKKMYIRQVLKKAFYLLSFICFSLFFCFCKGSNLALVEDQQLPIPILDDDSDKVPAYLKIDRLYHCPSNTENPYTLQYISFLSDTIVDKLPLNENKFYLWKTTKFINYPINRYVKNCNNSMLIALGDQEAKELHRWLLENQCKRTESMSIDMSLDNGNTCVIFPDSICIIVDDNNT